MTNSTVPDTVSMQADRYKAAFVWVTPEIAKRWLDRNGKNRRLNPATVARYQRDMEAGNWMFTGEAVKFADDGNLLDAQHRLEAITRSGCTVLMLVVRGLDQHSQDVMDTGRKRSAADMFALNGKTSTNMLAAIARMVIAYERGSIKNSQSRFAGEISHMELADAVAFDPMIEWATAIASTTRTTLPAKPSAIGFSAWLIGRSDPESARTFLRDLSEMRTNGAGDPRFTLLKRLSVARDNREALDQTAEAWLITKSWDAWRKGQTLKTLKLTTSAGPQAFIDPSAP